MGLLVTRLGLPVAAGGTGSGAATLGSVATAGSAAGSVTGGPGSVAASEVGSGTVGNSVDTSISSGSFSLSLCQEGVWRWLSDNSTFSFTNWKQFEPDNDGDGQNCLKLTQEGWRDGRCVHEYGFICQW